MFEIRNADFSHMVEKLKKTAVKENSNDITANQNNLMWSASHESMVSNEDGSVLYVSTNKTRKSNIKKRKNKSFKLKHYGNSVKLKIHRRKPPHRPPKKNKTERTE